MRYEVLRISLWGEDLLASFGEINHAWADVVHRWKFRKPSDPVYAVLDNETGQRWSYADIMELTKEPT